MMKNTEDLIKNKDVALLSEMLKAVAHPARIAIMILLCKQEDQRMTVKGIYKELKMSQPVISRHLAILRNVSLIEREAEGLKIFYSLNMNNTAAKQISRCFSTFKLNP